MTEETEITPDELSSYQSYVGRTIEHEDTIDRRVVQNLAATLDAAMPEGGLPPLWHYGLFVPIVPTSVLDEDGHPRRGNFLPPIRLPRRMFAGSSLTFHKPLSIGQPVTRVSRIASANHRRGKSGDLFFVNVASVLSQKDRKCVEEQQTIVYRSAGGTTPAVQMKSRVPVADGEVAKIWVPTEIELFRYSAATFNSHRIHYDRPYAEEIEGYPNLVVHGPLIATRLCSFAATVAGKEIKSFAFRAEAPCFVRQEMRVVVAQSGNGMTIRAERADGVTAMSATATTR